MGIGELNNYFEMSAEVESFDLPHGEFVARICKAFRLVLTVVFIFAACVGLLFSVFINKEIGYLSLGLSVCLALILPTILSYKCTVNKELLIEEYYIIFFKRHKEILWSNVKYRKSTVGRSKSIKFYDENIKLLIAFDGTTVGFSRILKLAKRSSIKDFPK
jgi:hypothetical protein